MRAELEQATAAELALKKCLAESRAAQKRLESERQSLKQARARDSQAKEEMRRTQARLEAELETIRVQVAKAERARAARESTKAPVTAEVASAGKVRVAEEASGEAVVAGKVVEVLSDGVLLAEVSRLVQGRSESFPEDLVVFLGLATIDGLSEGQEVAYMAEPATPHRYKYASGSTGRIRAYRIITE